MKDQDIEALSSYIDGELGDSERAAVERQLEEDTEFRAIFQKMRAFNLDLKAEFANSDSSQVAHRTRALLTNEDNVVAFPKPSRSPWKQAFAVAATVAAVSVISLNVYDSSPDAELLLSDALETLPSSAQDWHTLDDGSQLRPMLSFEHNNGQWCREYVLDQNNSTSHAVACRQHSTGNWETQIAASVTINPATNDYRPAGAEDSHHIADWVELNASDIPLGLSEEAAKIRNRWQ